MANAQRQRRHDERWQREVLDGMARMLDVLHDISDAVRALAEARGAPAALLPERRRNDHAECLLSVAEAADFLQVPAATLYTWRYRGQGPPGIRVGKYVRYRRQDIEGWLEQRRDERAGHSQSWRSSHLPGRIGSDVPSSSEPPKRSWCGGSNTEPMATPWSTETVDSGSTTRAPEGLAE
jgi:excisionase family DNA binding protein